MVNWIDGNLNFDQYIDTQQNYPNNVWCPQAFIKMIFT